MVFTPIAISTIYRQASQEVLSTKDADRIRAAVARVDATGRVDLSMKMRFMVGEWCPPAVAASIPDLPLDDE